MSVKYTIDIEITKDNDKIISCRFRELFLEKIINPYELDTNFSAEYKSYFGLVTFKGICLKQESESFFIKSS